MSEAPMIFDRHAVIDVDTHVTEPPGVFVDRVSRKWGDRVPHVVERRGIEIWCIGDKPFMPVGITSMAGFDGLLPKFPRTYAETDPASHDARARLAHMDREGIHAQVLYPNVGGFGSARFLELEEPALMLECVMAYNDFLIDWCSADPKRLLPIMATPFWDVDAAVKEIERCAARGHRGVLMGSEPHVFGQPHLVDPHWDPIWAAAQAAGLPISFHIGSGEMGNLLDGGPGLGVRTSLAFSSAQLFIENMNSIGGVIFGGICHRFPDLAFVSVESGASWVPFALEAFDWQWRNGDVRSEHPEYALLPSEYFRRQIYSCFWFEEQGLQRAIELYPDNMLYETDFPHPTSMSPGPQSSADRPRDYAERALGGLPDGVVAKVVHDNAARLYGL